MDNMYLFEASYEIKSFHSGCDAENNECKEKSADKKKKSESWKHLGGRGGAEGKYTRMARKRRPAGNAFEYMYLYKMFWCWW